MLRPGKDITITAGRNKHQHSDDATEEKIDKITLSLGMLVTFFAFFAISLS
jgi:hypothetical protein